MMVSAARIRAIFAITLLGVTVAGCGYNTIPTLEEQAKAKWSDVQNNYQRRADLIPNLVATVQGYAKQEREVLTSVVEARAKATSIKVDASQLTDPEKVKQFQDAQNQLSGALGRLIAISENYPDLKSNQNFLALQSQLEGTENRIASRAAITLRRSVPTIRSSRRSPAYYGPRRSSAPTSRWRSSPQVRMRPSRRK